MKFVAPATQRRVLVPEIAQASHLPYDFMERIDEYAPHQDVSPGVTRHWDGRDESTLRVPAIKAYRQATGCGLMEAKHIIEFFLRQGYTWTTVTHE